MFVILGLCLKCVSGFQGSALYLESSHNITMNARDASEAVTNRLFIGKFLSAEHSRQYKK